MVYGRTTHRILMKLTYYVEDNTITVHTNLHKNPSGLFWIICKSAKIWQTTHKMWFYERTTHRIWMELTYYVEGSSMSIHADLFWNLSGRFWIISKSGENITKTHIMWFYGRTTHRIWMKLTYCVEGNSMSVHTYLYQYLSGRY